MSMMNQRSFTPDAGATDILEALCVQIEPGVTLGHPRPREIIIEPPVRIRPGTYDIDFLGAFTFMGGRQTELRHVGMIGRFCSIAYNIMAGVEEHPHDYLSPSPAISRAFRWKQLEPYLERNADIVAETSRHWRQRQETQFGKIDIGSDVWIGEGALIRRGISIGDGAVIAARAVVTKDVPPYAIVAGTPAKILRYRFEPAVVAALLHLRWWSYGVSALDGVDMTDIHAAIDKIDANIASGRAQPYDTPLVVVDAAGGASAIRFDQATGGITPAEPQC